MTLEEVINRIDDYAEDAAIYAEQTQGHWYPDSLAFVTEKELDGVFQTFEGVPMKYLLEIDLAREVIEVYQEHHYTRTPSNEEKLTAVIYYAENDCYLPPSGSTV